MLLGHNAGLTLKLKQKELSMNVLPSILKQNIVKLLKA